MGFSHNKSLLSPVLA
ncbi:uncharacterized protein FFB14_00003 [Fusarium fujikuroi]|nr:uncharacterized protein FFB14_00003 [Fusarium fujikuroi]